MTELMPGSGVYLYPADLGQARRKARLPDQLESLGGVRLARALMSSFWASKELVGATISQSPIGDKFVLNQRLVNAIIGMFIACTFCEHVFPANCFSQWTKIFIHSFWPKRLWVCITKITVL